MQGRVLYGQSRSCVSCLACRPPRLMCGAGMDHQPLCTLGALPHIAGLFCVGTTEPSCLLLCIGRVAALLPLLLA